MWTTRFRTPIGRITVINTLLLSKLFPPVSHIPTYISNGRNLKRFEFLIFNDIS